MVGVPWRKPDIPDTYIPSTGEVVYARRSASDRYLRASVWKVWPEHLGVIKVGVVWLEDDLTLDPPLLKATKGWLRARPWPPLIKKVEEV